MIKMRKVAGAVLVAVAMSACATKGFVMRQVAAARDTSRMGWTAGDSAVRDSVKSSVASLQRDLGMLRDSLGARITAMEHGMQFILPVTFSFNDATVRDADHPVLDRFAKVISKHYNGSLLTVEGFADPAGGVAYNQRLSKKRAENVIAYLGQAGMAGVTMRPVGMGKTRFVVDKASRDMPGAESNRRVVFVIESVGQGGTTTAGDGAR
jgi:outer membrane protein OmpA-like peptidoglycan-associated protein